MCRFSTQTPSKPCSHIMCNCAQPSYFDHSLLSSKPTKRHFDNDHTVSFIENLNFAQKKNPTFHPIIIPKSNIMVKTEPTEVLSVHRVSLPRLPSFEMVLKSMSKPEEFPATDSKMLETLNFLTAQQNSMIEMTAKEDELEQTLSLLAQEMAIIRSNFEQKIKYSKAQEQQASEIKLVATSEMLLAQMYPKNPEFLYALNVVGEFPQTLCREKPFNLTLELVDLRTGARVMNPNKIEISLAMYTATNPPKLITINTTGEKPFKGDTTSQVTNGSATFTKIYPNEVSSHYMTGCVFLVAVPKFTSEYAERMKIVSQYCGEVMVDPSMVRPWVLDRVVIKAKKSKE